MLAVAQFVLSSILCQKTSFGSLSGLSCPPGVPGHDKKRGITTSYLNLMEDAYYKMHAWIINKLLHSFVVCTLYLCLLRVDF